MDIVKNYHKDLIKYKNLHKGEVAYIFGSGPSLKKFKIQEKGVFIGCNKIYKSKYIRENLNYYFFGDGQKRVGNAKELDKYGDKLTYKEEVDLLIEEKKVQCFCNASMHGTLNFHHKFTNFAIAVSMGHTSHTKLELYPSRCLSNFSRDSKTRSHFSQ